MYPRLQFNVKNQSITRIDEFKVVANSKNYLYADFQFMTGDWRNVKAKTAIFDYDGGTKHAILDENDSCLVPWEALAESGFMQVSVFGGDLITVGTAKVRVYESGYKEGTAPKPPTPDVYEQLLKKVEDIKDVVETKVSDVAEDEEVDEVLNEIFGDENEDEQKTD